MSRIRKNTKTFWARLAVDYYRDAKILRVGPVGEVAFVRLICLAREKVETSKVPGGMERIEAIRELYDLYSIYDLWRKANPIAPANREDQSTGDAILELLVSEGLITLTDDQVMLVSYDVWQTTSDEIKTVREESAQRQREARERKKRLESEYEGSEESEHEEVKEENSATKNRRKKGEENEMAVYDKKVGPFEDLRETDGVRRGKTKLGKHGLDPKYTEDVEKVIKYFGEARTKYIGTKFRVTDVWYGDVQKLLKGTESFEGYTVGQLCDLIDFALNDEFWATHTQTPAGLLKHGHKLYGAPNFIAWSIYHKRPEENRPRNKASGNKKTAKGTLAADTPVDWKQESGDF